MQNEGKANNRWVVPNRWLRRSIARLVGRVLAISIFVALIATFSGDQHEGMLERIESFFGVTAFCLLAGLITLKYHHQNIHLDSEVIYVKGWFWRRTAFRIEAIDSVSILASERVTFWLGKGIAPAACWLVKILTSDGESVGVVGDLTAEVREEMGILAQEVASALNVSLIDR